MEFPTPPKMAAKPGTTQKPLPPPYDAIQRLTQDIFMYGCLWMLSMWFLFMMTVYLLIKWLP